MLRRFLLLTLFTLLLVAVLPIALAQADCDFSYSNYARAVQLHGMGDYDRALQHYHCALQEDPDDAIIPRMIRNVYEDIAAAPLAWSRDESATSVQACDPALDHALLGTEAHDAGDDNRALVHLHCVLLDDPTQVDSLYRVGMIHINRGQTHEAKHFFDRSDRAAGARLEDADLLVYLLGEDARAVIDAESLANLSLTSPDPGASGEYLPPGHEYLATYLVVIWTRQGSRDEARPPDDLGARGAIDDLQRALEQDPTRLDLRCQLGRLYKARGDYAAAYGQFSTLIVETLGDHCRSAVSGAESSAVEAEPMTSASADAKPAPVSPAEQAYAEGLRNYEAGKLYVAANIFLHALKVDPLHMDARCKLGMIYTEWAHYRGALEQFDYVLQRDPGDSCARQQRTIAARDMLAILTPLVVDDYFHYARTYTMMGEWQLARDAFLKGLEIDPLRYDVRCELGMLYAQLGDDRAALTEFDLALFADDMDSCARANRYALLQRMRRY